MARQAWRGWAAGGLVFVFGPLVSAALTAWLLDSFVRRPAYGGSITTILPGWTYANATVLKVCLMAGVLMLVAAARERGGLTGSNLLASLVLTGLTPLMGAAIILVAQALPAVAPAMGDFARYSRVAVFVTLAALAGAALLAGLALRFGERPRHVAALALAANVLLIALFWHFEFYHLAFDQDTWAPR